MEEEIGFEMRNTGSARKLITKLQKFRFLDEKLKEKPDKKSPRRFANLSTCQLSCARVCVYLKLLSFQVDL